VHVHAGRRLVRPHVDLRRIWVQGDSCEWYVLKNFVPIGKAGHFARHMTLRTRRVVGTRITVYGFARTPKAYRL
jgi:hypothetical protein